MKTIPTDHGFVMRLRVEPTMTARFFGVELHPVYATFAIVQHAEYAGRQAIIGFLEAHEDAVGTEVRVRHLASAPVGAVVEHRVRVSAVEGRTITCAIEVRWNDLLIAEGHTEQRVVDRERLHQALTSLHAGPKGSSRNE